MRVPEDASADVRQAFIEVHEKINNLTNRNIDLKGRRIINAGRSQSENDYVTRAEITGEYLTPVVQDVTYVSGGGGGSGFLSGVYYPWGQPLSYPLSLTTGAANVALYVESGISVFDGHIRIEGIGTAHGHRLDFHDTGGLEYYWQYDSTTGSGFRLVEEGFGERISFSDSNEENEIEITLSPGLDPLWEFVLDGEECNNLGLLFFRPAASTTGCAGICGSELETSDPYHPYGAGMSLFGEDNPSPGNGGDVHIVFGGRGVAAPGSSKMSISGLHSGSYYYSHIAFFEMTSATAGVIRPDWNERVGAQNTKMTVDLGTVDYPFNILYIGTVYSTYLSSSSYAALPFIRSAEANSKIIIYKAGSATSIIELSSQNSDTDALIEVGSSVGYRGAIWIRAETSTPRCGVLILEAEDGDDHYIWVDTSGNLRKGAAGVDPGADDTLGSIVGAGDVAGPSSATDNAIVRFDGTGGKTIQDYTSYAPTVSDDGAAVFRNTLTIYQSGTTNNIFQVSSAVSDTDALVEVGSYNVHRGALWIRESSTRTEAGVLILAAEDGDDHYIWVDTSGNLRIGAANTDPGADDTSGSALVKTPMTADLDPDGADTYNLGDSTNRWEDAYIDDIYTNTIRSTGTTVEVFDDLLPGGGTEDLGSAAAAWVECHIQQLRGENETDGSWDNYVALYDGINQAGILGADSGNTKFGFELGDGSTYRGVIRLRRNSSYGGVLDLESPNGTDYGFWVDNSGNLRVTSADSDPDSGDTYVGDQAA